MNQAAAPRTSVAEREEGVAPRRYKVAPGGRTAQRVTPEAEVAYWLGWLNDTFPCAAHARPEAAAAAGVTPPHTGGGRWRVCSPWAYTTRYCSSSAHNQRSMIDDR
eukprot:COSAG01_NODE_2281_length_8005_cov_4.513408_10_plen_106_part_00